MNKNKLPYWAYEDNPKSNWTPVVDDMLTSEKFYKVLTPGEQLFYIKCLSQWKTKQCKECLYKALEERYNAIGEPKSKEDLALMVYNPQNRYGKDLFVFPSKHAKRYGYTSAYISKTLKALEEKGYIKTFQNGQYQHKVNIYEFSSKWKVKPV